MPLPWRKIWPSVSLSKKVNKLSDEAALFWTWAIPHFSTHGLLEYDPEDLKLMVIPMRKDMPAKKILGYVQEIISVKLWLAFEAQNGKIILFDPKWFEMQNIRKDRMGKPPYNIKEMKQIFTLLPDTPGHSRIVPEFITTPGVSRTIPDTPDSRILLTTPTESESESESEIKDKESAESEKTANCG